MGGAWLRRWEVLVTGAELSKRAGAASATQAEAATAGKKGESRQLPEEKKEAGKKASERSLLCLDKNGKLFGFRF
nr:hypothetical protein Iba_chr15aCG12020 [Ipomoea batatas]